MDTTVTTKNQLPHESCDSGKCTINENGSGSNSNSSCSNSFVNYYNNVNESSKNKRKNFNPRCSSMSADEDDVDQSKNQLIIDKIVTKNNIVCDDEMSQNWRKLLIENHQSADGVADKNQQNIVNLINPSTTTPPSSLTTKLNDIEKNKFYNIPNTNFSIAKSAAIDSLTAALANQHKQHFDQQLSAKMLNSDNSDSNNVAEQQINSAAQTAVAAVAANANDSQARLEFACNAFNAVQELLNVYALSLSPGDIVDAFKRQMICATTIIGGTSSTSTAISTRTTSAPAPASSTSTITLSSSTAVHHHHHHHHPTTALTEKCSINQHQQQIALEPPTPPRTPITGYPPSIIGTLTSSDTFNHQSAIMKLDNEHYQHTIDARQKSPIPSTISPNCRMSHDDDDDDYGVNDKCQRVRYRRRPSSSSSSSSSSHKSTSKIITTSTSTITTSTPAINLNVTVSDDTRLMDNTNCSTRTSYRYDDSNVSDNGENINRNDSDSDNDDDDDDISGIVNDYDRFSENDSNAHHHHHHRADDDNNSINQLNDSIANDGSFIDDVSSKVSLKNVESLLDKSSLNFLSPILHLATLHGEEKQLSADSTKYLKKFSSFLDCNNQQCVAENQREHYHCYDVQCFGKILNKKEEIIRHLKWHKKRNESLNHGFLRFSSNDDCQRQFGQCTHNRKQTHYHCLQTNCDKVYISTSDVQMHSNYHRKDSAIIQEGFQRFRATEDCNVSYCIFAGQRTTHFHCRRSNCLYTFKNKADMEKHKTYHIKDEQLARDGFKKFLKNEICPYENCRFSNICNHIHCVRDNCYYVLHSSGQLMSHKRKHDRLDSEHAYRLYKMTQQKSLSISPASSMIAISSPAISPTGSVAAAPPPPPTATTTIPTISDILLQSQLSAITTTASTATTPTATAVNQQSIGAPLNDLNLLYGRNITNPLPTEILQQIHQQQKQFLFKQNYPIDGSNTDIKRQIKIEPNVYEQQQKLQLINDNLEDGIPKTIIHTANYFDKNIIDGSSSSSMPSMNLFDIYAIIQRYFTDNCTKKHHQGQTLSSKMDDDNDDDDDEQNEPLNLKSHLSKECERKSSTSSLITQIMSTSKVSQTFSPIKCNWNKDDLHLHCLIRGCDTILLSENFNLIIEHICKHDLYQRNFSTILSNNLMQSGGAVGGNIGVDCIDQLTSSSAAAAGAGASIAGTSGSMHVTSIDGFFNRKRGRPPKNRVIEVYNNVQHNSPQAIFTSFKLEKGNEMMSQQQLMNNCSTLSQINDQQEQQSECRRFKFISATEKCFDNRCPYDHQLHFHCDNNIRCHFSTTYAPAMDKHMIDFHGTNGCLIGKLSNTFDFFDQSYDCRIFTCTNNKKNHHFHCILCFVSLTIDSDLSAHDCRTMNSIDATNRTTKLSETICSNNGIVGNRTLSSDIDDSDNDNDKKIRRTILNVEASTSLTISEKCNISKNSEIKGNINDDYDNEHDRVLDNDRDDDDGDDEENNYENRMTDCSSNDDMDIDISRNKSEILNDNQPLSIPMQTTSCGGSSTAAINIINTDDERVSVVRAAGTYFPQNSNDDHAADADNADYKQTNTITSKLSTTTASATTTIDTIKCLHPFCKLKRKHHQHCDYCNQAFTDEMKLKIHYLKHQTTKLSHFTAEMQRNVDDVADSADDNQLHSEDNKIYLPSSSSTSTFNKLSTSANISQQEIVDMTLTNLHMAHLAYYHHRNSLYYQLYPYLNNTVTHADNNESTSSLSGTQPPHYPFLSSSSSSSNINQHFDLPPLGSDILMHDKLKQYHQQSASASTSSPSSSTTTKLLQQSNKRKFIDNQHEDNDNVIGEHQQPSAKKQQRSTTINNNTNNINNNNNNNNNGTTNFKMFKDEPIPNGYLKFRFNEDCNFINCGYRNHQSHFHCCRMDCYYSFCDKTRFVQHTARHERLDKLMGEDFKQYRANMRCGYDECVYNKNMGANNKSSHFHCMKCNFICSDTNKVVAHRRQHSKLEYIRMAGFRKVSNNEKCSNTMPTNLDLSAIALAANTEENCATATTSGNSSRIGNCELSTSMTATTSPSTAATTTSMTPSAQMVGSECSYSMKQTHYHCLVCDCSVLSRAQLGSHRHRI